MTQGLGQNSVGGESLIFRPQNKILQFSGGLRVCEFIKKERGSLYVILLGTLKNPVRFKAVEIQARYQQIV